MKTVIHGIIAAALLHAAAFAQEPVGIFDGYADIGQVSIPGGAMLGDGDIYQLEAGGAGVTDFADGFLFVYKEMTGSFAIEGAPLVFGGGRAGLMIRQDLTPESIHASYMRTGAGTVFPMFRTLPGESVSDDGEYEPPANFDGSIRLERVGNSIHYYAMDENLEWSLQQTEILQLDDPVYVGLAASAQDDNGFEIFDVDRVEIEEFPLSVSRSFSADAPAPGAEMQVTLAATAASAVDGAVTETIPQGAEVSNIEASGGEPPIVENGSIAWNLPAFEGAATLTYNIALPNSSPIRWTGTFSDGERTGWIGGVAIVADSFGFEPRESLSVHPVIPRFIEAEWGERTGDETAYGLQMELRSESAILVQANGGEGSGLLEYTLDVQETGTYYIFAQGRTEDNQSDSIFIGIDDIGTDDTFGYPIGGAKNLSRLWWEGYNDGGRFWERNGVIRPFELSAGEHTLIMGPRETHAKMDWIVITSDPTINLGNFVPAEQFFSISRDLPVADTLPGRVPVTLNLGVVQDSAVNLLVEEILPEGWTAEAAEASAGETAFADGVLTWTVPEAGGDATLSYEAVPPPGATFGIFSGTAQNTDNGFTIAVSGGGSIPAELPFTPLSEPIDVGPETVFVQTESPHAFAGGWAVRPSANLPSQRYAEATEDGRDGSNLTGSQLEFNLNFLQDGTYYIFMQATGPSDQEDSMFFGFDEIANDPAQYATALPRAFERLWIEILPEGNNFWETGGEPRPFDISAGPHTFIIHSREPNAKIDWFAITMDPELDIETLLEPGRETNVMDYMIHE